MRTYDDVRGAFFASFGDELVQVWVRDARVFVGRVVIPDRLVYPDTGFLEIEQLADGRKAWVETKSIVAVELVQTGILLREVAA